LAMIYLVLYSISQFFIFFVRDNIVILGGLKQAQVTALVVIALTLPVIAYLLRKERLIRRVRNRPPPHPRRPRPRSPAKGLEPGDLGGSFAALAALEQQLEEPLGLKLGLLDNGFHLAVEPLPVLGAQSLGRVDEDRHPAQFFIAA